MPRPRARSSEFTVEHLALTIDNTPEVHPLPTDPHHHLVEVLGSGEVVEQRLGVYKIGSVEALGEPVVNRSEQVPGFCAATLVAV